MRLLDMLGELPRSVVRAEGNVDTGFEFGVRQCKSGAPYHDERTGDLGGRWCHSDFPTADEKLR